MLKNGLPDLNSLHSCPHLHRLQELHLQVVFGSDTIGPELAALLQHTPRLATLQLVGSGSATLRWHTLLPSLSGCCGLTRLAIVGVRLSDSPDGEYLTGEVKRGPLHCANYLCSLAELCNQLADAAHSFLVQVCAP